MKLNELKVAKSNQNNFIYYDYIIDRFKENGYSNIGSGAFSMIFSKENIDHVYKIYKKDNAYFEYLLFCLNNQNNKFIPKIIEMKKFSNSILGIVKMEKLYPINKNDLVSLDNNNEYLKTMKEIEELGFHLDIEKDNNNSLRNLMKRKNGEIVITDPIYDPYHKDDITYNDNNDKSLLYILSMPINKFINDYEENFNIIFKNIDKILKYENLYRKLIYKLLYNLEYCYNNYKEKFIKLINIHTFRDKLFTEIISNDLNIPLDIFKQNGKILLNKIHINNKNGFIKSLPNDMILNELVIVNDHIDNLPDDIIVKNSIMLMFCKNLKSLPETLKSCNKIQIIHNNELSLKYSEWLN